MLSRGRALKGNRDREHGKNWGALQRGWRTGRLCWGGRGELRGLQGILMWVRAVVGDT